MIWEKTISPNEMSGEEFAVLEQFDKFFNLMMRAVALSPGAKTLRDLHSMSFFDYWCAQVWRDTDGLNDDFRSDLRKYMERFYANLMADVRAATTS